MIATSFLQSVVRRVGRVGVLTLLVWGAVWGTAFADETPPIAELTIGTSTENRPIEAVRFGTGPRKLVVVGATHGWPERNTYELSRQLIAYFREHPDEVPERVSMYIVPLLNPDGMALETRFNARTVDLNRNMDTSADGCPPNDWRASVNGAYGIVSETGGAYQESEVESRLIRDFLLDADGVIFFHSNAGVVFPACDHALSRAMARTFAAAADYTFTPRWDKYDITGGMHDWAGGMDIPAITPELVTGELPEFEQNLAGVKAVLAKADSLLREPKPRTIGAVAVEPVIWRAWRAWGGEAVWGPPLGPPTRTADGWEQIFTNVRFDYQPAQTDTRFAVQLAPLGRELLQADTPAADVAAAEPPSGEAANPDEASIELDPVFAVFGERRGGATLFGDVLGTAAETEAADGARVVRQPFERVVIERPAGSDRIEDVRLVPLGRVAWAQQDAVSGETAWRAR